MPRARSTRAPTVAPSFADVPLATRAIVDAARRTVRGVAPDAAEVACQSRRPKSPSMMWKLARYVAGGEIVVTIGTFTRHAAIFFARGSELADAKGLLEGTGKNLRYISLRQPDDVATPGVRKILRDAFALAAPRPR